MGYVLQINADSALVSLPAGLTGIIEYSEICDSYHKTYLATKPKDRKSLQFTPLDKLLSVHQPVRCYVLGLQERANSRKKKTTYISCRLYASLPLCMYFILAV